MARRSASGIGLPSARQRIGGSGGTALVVGPAGQRPQAAAVDADFVQAEAAVVVASLRPAKRMRSPSSETDGLITSISVPPSGSGLPQVSSWTVPRGRQESQPAFAGRPEPLAGSGEPLALRGGGGEARGFGPRGEDDGHRRPGVDEARCSRGSPGSGRAARYAVTPPRIATANPAASHGRCFRVGIMRAVTSPCQGPQEFQCRVPDPWSARRPFPT